MGLELWLCTGFGLSLSCASTVVLLKALGDRGLLDSNGKIAVGWLLVEDLVMVLVLVLLPATAVLLGGKAPAGAEGNIWLTLGITLLKVIGFIAFMLIVVSVLFLSLCSLLRA